MNHYINKKPYLALKKMKRLSLSLSALFFLLASCLWTQTGRAQKTDFPVPKKYKLKKGKLKD